MPTKTESPPVKNREAKELEFQGLKGKKVSIVFDEPELTSDAGFLAIAELEKSLGWIEKLAGCISDRRIGPVHSIVALLSQRIYQIIGGYPDANDCDRMRNDGTVQTMVPRRVARSQCAAGWRRWILRYRWRQHLRLRHARTRLRALAAGDADIFSRHRRCPAFDVRVLFSRPSLRSERCLCRD